MKSLSEAEEIEIIDLLKEFKPEATTSALDQKIIDLGIDSMDFITLLFDVEDKYSITIDAAEVDMQNTLREFIVETSSKIRSLSND